jgi:transcriptional regulator with XRE-family HTH domain
MTTILKKPRDTDSLDLHIGKRLRLLRKMAGYSYQEFINKLKNQEGVSLSIQQIQKYEGGRSKISSGRLYRIGLIFGKEVTYFFEGFQNQKEQTYSLSYQFKSDGIYK